MKAVVSLFAAATVLALYTGASKTTVANPVEFYISTQGKDSWSGTLPEVNASGTDGPFATLERAQEAVRSARKSGAQPVTVSIRAGVYPLEQSLRFGPDDSGTLENPVVWRSYNNENVSIVGTKQIGGFRKLANAQIAARLSADARAHVVEADLRSQGISDYGQLRARGFLRDIQPAPMELFFDGRPMTLAQWPNSGWAVMSGALAPETRTFIYDGEEPARIKSTKDVWIHGYFTYTYADYWEPVVSIDSAKHQISTAVPAARGTGAYRKDSRYLIVNALEELDSPGEYYIDRETGMLYFWPPGDVAKAKTYVSMLEDPLVRARVLSNVRFEGLSFEMSRGAGVEIAGRMNVQLHRCTLRNLGGVAVSVGTLQPDLYWTLYNDTTFTNDPGVQNGLDECRIYDVGEGGVILGGGDRKTLAKGQNYVRGCEIHDVNRWVQTFRPGVFVYGVGNDATSNHIYSAPHTGIYVNGNDNTVEYNDLHNLCTQTTDAGAVYMGRDPSQRGNIFRYNYIHDLSGPPRTRPGISLVMGIYLDDVSSGATVESNVFKNVLRAVYIGGGRDNLVENNVFIDCAFGVHVDDRGISKDATYERRMRAVNFDAPPYSTRYPDLASMLRNQPDLPKGNRVLDNVFQGGQFLDISDTVPSGLVEARNNVTSGAHFDGLQPAPAPRPPGFQALPLDKMVHSVP